MDLYCPKCGEPWDTDSVYHENDRPELTPTEAGRLFARNGCGAIFDGIDCRPSADRAEFSVIASGIYELAGDDLDGAASDFADAEYLGLL